MNNNVSIDKKIPLHANSPGFNNTPKGTGEQFKRFGTDSHGGVTSPTTKDIKQL